MSTLEDVADTDSEVLEIGNNGVFTLWCLSFGVSTLEDAADTELSAV